MDKFITPLHGAVIACDTRVRFTERGLRELAAAESEHHARLGVTGHAYLHDSRLIEYIEGPAESLDTLIAALERDPRFTVRQIIRTPSVAARRFPAWHLDTCTDDELMDLRLEHVLEAVMQNFASSFFGEERTQSAIWRLVDAIARRQAKAGKASRARATKLVMVH